MHSGFFGMLIFFFPLQQFWLQLLLYNHLQHSVSSFPTCLILKRKWFFVVCLAFVSAKLEQVRKKSECCPHVFNGFWGWILCEWYLSCFSFPCTVKKKLAGTQKLKMMWLRNVTNMEELSTSMLTKTQLRYACFWGWHTELMLGALLLSFVQGERYKYGAFPKLYLNFLVCAECRWFSPIVDHCV